MNNYAEPGEINSDMAKAQLMKIANYAKTMFNNLNSEDQLPDWVKSKITSASEHMGAVKHWMDYEMKGDMPLAKRGHLIKPSKVGVVMREFKEGRLYSSSGQKVTDRKQAIAIAMSEAGMSRKKMASGGTLTDVMSFEEFKRKLPVLHNVKWGDKDVEYVAKYNPYTDSTMYFKYGRRNSEKLSLAEAYKHYKYFAEQGREYAKGGEITDKTISDFMIALEESKIMSPGAHKNPAAIKTIKSIVTMSKSEYEAYIKELPNRKVEMIYTEFQDWKKTYARGGGVRKKRPTYAIMMSQFDNPQYVEVSSRDMAEAIEAFKRNGITPIASMIYFSNTAPYYYEKGGDLNVEYDLYGFSAR